MADAIGPTTKQTDYILHLANQATGSHCRYLDQHRKYIHNLCGINVTNMNKYEASTVIGTLLDELDVTNR